MDPKLNLELDISGLGFDQISTYKKGGSLQLTFFRKPLRFRGLHQLFAIDFSFYQIITIVVGVFLGAHMFECVFEITLLYADLFVDFSA